MVFLLIEQAKPGANEGENGEHEQFNTVPACRRLAAGCLKWPTLGDQPPCLKRRGRTPGRATWTGRSADMAASADRGAVAILEANSLDDTRRFALSFPLAQAGLLEVKVISLTRYAGFAGLDIRPGHRLHRQATSSFGRCFGSISLTICERSRLTTFSSAR